MSHISGEVWAALDWLEARGLEQALDLVVFGERLASGTARARAPLERRLWGDVGHHDLP